MHRHWATCTASVNLFLQEMLRHEMEEEERYGMVWKRVQIWYDRTDQFEKCSHPSHLLQLLRCHAAEHHRAVGTVRIVYARGVVPSAISLSRELFLELSS